MGALVGISGRQSGRMSAAAYFGCVALVTLAGIGVAMLDHLVNDAAEHGISTLETTVSPDNEASVAMFASLARRRGAQMIRESLFAPEDFPDGHEPEDLYRISPLRNSGDHITEDHG